MLPSDGPRDEFLKSMSDLFMTHHVVLENYILRHHISIHSSVCMSLLRNIKVYDVYDFVVDPS